MSRKLSRREFLKLLAGVSPGVYLSRFAQGPSRVLQDGGAKNVLIIVFDALSAKNISLYGYPRETMPNLARMAERATVYHNHYAGGNWTIPGTASLLTGTYPWTHRALNGRVIEERRHKTIFSVFDRYYRVAYSHNSLVNNHLNAFISDINYLKPQRELLLRNDLAFDRFFSNDYDLASVAWERAVKNGETGYSYSLFFSNLYDEYSQQKIGELSQLFPRGVPRFGQDNYFLLEEGIDWLKSQLTNTPQPFLGYFHFLPPHHPYNPRREFITIFRGDGVSYLIDKPKSIFSEKLEINLKSQAWIRQQYDEFILFADEELGRLYDYLLESHLVDNTWIVLTSDHGEMNERGIRGHNTPVLYEPVIRIPLLILEPGQVRRRDVYSATSAVDVLPTLAKVTGQEVPEWVEGRVLPPFSEEAADENRSVYAVEAKQSKEGEVLSPVTTMLVKGKHKLMYFSGYEELGEAGSHLEQYDLEEDPEEMDNVYNPQSSLSQEFREELDEKIREADKPYQKD